MLNCCPFNLKPKVNFQSKHVGANVIFPLIFIKRLPLDVNCLAPSNGFLVQGQGLFHFVLGLSPQYIGHYQGPGSTSLVLQPTCFQEQVGLRNLTELIFLVTLVALHLTHASQSLCWSEFRYQPSFKACKLVFSSSFVSLGNC